jgi:hypothetical protein
MATSPYNDTVFILDFLGRLIFGKQASILDVGSGFGRWGFLCRCHLGCGIPLAMNLESKLRVEAIEAYKPNVTPIYDCVYNATHIGDAQEVLSALGEYDIVICSHMIEHLKKEEGLRLLDQMRSHASKAVIVALPFGEWPQDDAYGNPYEVHKAVWQPADFRGHGAYIRRFGKEQGIAIIPIDAEATWQVKMMKNPLRRWVFQAIRRVRLQTTRRDH